jgi:Cu-Zn family superoxide dismutase
MRRIAPLALISVAALVLGLASPADASHRRGTYLIDPSGTTAAADVFPEGVATDRRTFFVGSTTDGTIYRGRLKGSTAVPFLLGDADRSMAVGLKVDEGKLFVAGGGTGKVFIYDIRSKALVGSFQVPDPGSPTFVNDLTVAKDNSVYVTDSFRPTLYRIAPGAYANSSPQTLEVFKDFTGTVLPINPGFNLNGIVAARNGKFLVLAHSGVGKLFRLRLSDRAVAQIDLGHDQVSGDGLVLLGRRLFVVERQGDVGYLVKVRLKGRASSGRLISRTTYPSFDDPTTAAFARGRLLVVNSQFGERSAGETPDPFTVSRVRLP